MFVAKGAMSRCSFVSCGCRSCMFIWLAKLQYVFLYLAENSFAPDAVRTTLLLLYITGANLSFLELAELRVYSADSAGVTISFVYCNSWRSYSWQRKFLFPTAGIPGYYEIVINPKRKFLAVKRVNADTVCNIVRKP
jgi:hypothetical protein